jgi:hypothetical protein
MHTSSPLEPAPFLFLLLLLLQLLAENLSAIDVVNGNKMIPQDLGIESRADKI